MSNDHSKDAIFNKLDELFPAGVFDGYTSSSDQHPNANADQIGTAKAISGNTSDKGYRKLVASRNITSYSKTELLHACPRLFELEMWKSNSKILPSENESANIDFAFGHAVGAGIQTYGTTRSVQASMFAAFMAWRAPWDAEKLDFRGNPTGKSLAWACHAVEKFAFWFENTLAGEWEVLVLPNGKPAVELAFGVDAGNGYFHVGHVDTILQHRESKRLAVWEGKTTGRETVDDATYANSYQALGYSVVVDALTHQLGLPSSDYEVFYITYSSKSREFIFLPFPKSASQRAEWLQDLLLTHATLDKYYELEFFPKRGDNCINKWGRKCTWYGTCHMRNESLFPGTELAVMDSLDQIESLDFRFTLDQLIAGQRNRK
jgi:hypothetical protein